MEGREWKGRENISITYMFGSNDGRGGILIKYMFGSKGRGEILNLNYFFYPSDIKIVSRFLNYSLHKKLNMKTL